MATSSTNDPYYIDGSGNWIKIQPGTIQSGSTINIDPGSFSGYASTTYTTPKRCRSCGKEISAIRIMGTLSASVNLCDTCSEAFVESMLRRFIPKDKYHCTDCFSHIDACSCPKKKELDKLKS